MKFDELLGGTFSEDRKRRPAKRVSVKAILSGATPPSGLAFTEKGWPAAPAPDVLAGLLTERKVIAGRYRPELHPRGPGGRFAAKPKPTRAVPNRPARTRGTPSRYAGTLGRVRAGTVESRIGAMRDTPSIRNARAEITAARQAGLVRSPAAVRKLEVADGRDRAEYERLGVERSRFPLTPEPEDQAHVRKLDARRDLLLHRMNRRHAELDAARREHGHHELTEAGRAELHAHDLHEAHEFGDSSQRPLYERLDKGEDPLKTPRDKHGQTSRQQIAAAVAAGEVEKTPDGGYRLTAQGKGRLDADRRRQKLRDENVEADTQEIAARDIEAGDLVGGWAVQRVEARPDGKVNLWIDESAGIRLVVPADRAIPAHRPAPDEPKPKPRPKPRPKPKPKPPETKPATSEMDNIRAERDRVRAEMGNLGLLAKRPGTNPYDQRVAEIQAARERYESYLSQLDEWKRTGNAKALLARGKITQDRAANWEGPKFDADTRKGRQEWLSDLRDDDFYERHRRNIKEQQRSVEASMPAIVRYRDEYAEAHPNQLEPDDHPDLPSTDRKNKDAPLGTAGASERLIGHAQAVRDLGRQIDAEALRRIDKASIPGGPLTEEQLLGERKRIAFEIVNLRRKMDQLDDERYRETDQSASSRLEAEIDVLDLRIQQLQTNRDDLVRRRQDTDAALRAARLQVISELRPMGGRVDVVQGEKTVAYEMDPSGKTTMVVNTPEARRAADRGAEYLPADWVAAIPPINVSAGVSRGYSTLGTIALSGSPGPRQDRVAAHELAHQAQKARPAVAALEWGYWTHRTTDPPEGSKKRTWSADSKVKQAHDYLPAGEVGRADKFADAYAGKFYGTQATSWELAPMGAETFVRGADATMAPDTDFVHFTLGLWATA